MSKCIDAVMKAFDDLPKAKVEGIVSNLLEIQNSAKSQSDFNKRAFRYLEDVREKLAQSRLEKSEAEIKRISRKNFYEQNAFEGDKREALMAYMVGTNRISEGGNLSVYALASSRADRLKGEFQARMRKLDAEKMVARGELDKEIAVEMVSPGKSGSKTAYKVAELFRQTNRNILNMMQRSGIPIRELKDFIMTQSHDPSKLKQTGFDDWFEFILDKVDMERTFGHVSDPEHVQAILKQMYDDLVLGKHLYADGSHTDDALAGLLGNGQNINRRFSKSRMLHFKDGESFYEYNQRFGNETIMESIIHRIDTAARNSALVEKFGANPEAELRADLDRYSDEIKVHERRGIENAFRLVQGATSMPAQTMAGKTAANLRAVANLSKLGGAYLASFPDLAANGVVIKDATGKNLLQSVSGAMDGYFSLLKSKDQRVELARKFGHLIDDYVGSVNEKYGAFDNVEGALHNIQNKFFKANLLTQHTEASALMIAKQFGLELGKNTSRSFDDLNPNIRATFDRYGIDAETWDIYRGLAEDIGDGDKLVSPDLIDQLDNSAIESMMINKGLIKSRTPNKHQKVADFKQKLSENMFVMFHDLSKIGTLQPDARVRSFMLQGTTADDPLGIMLRFVGQFKSFGLAAFGLSHRTLLNDPIKRPRNLKEGANIQSFAQFLVLSTALGYAAMVAKDAVKGRTPKDPTDPDTFAEALMRGGAAGLYGDFLLSQAQYSGRKQAFSFVAGPVLSDAVDLIDLGVSTVKGEKTAARALRFTRNQVPFQNLFYTQTALDYLFFNELQESLNPGYLRRHTQRIEQDQSFFIPSPLEASR